MSGGVCEASAFSVYGYQTTGIAFPLGNYHNGAPEGGVEAEYIHVDDYLGGVELMVEAAHAVADRGNTAFRDRLRQVPEETRRRLMESADKPQLPAHNPPLAPEIPLRGLNCRVTAPLRLVRFDIICGVALLSVLGNERKWRNG